MKPAGEILPGREIMQLFQATADEMAVISPKLATYGGRAAGTLTVSLHRVVSRSTQKFDVVTGRRSRR